MQIRLHITLINYYTIRPMFAFKELDHLKFQNSKTKPNFNFNSYSKFLQILYVSISCAAFDLIYLSQVENLSYSIVNLRT